MTKRSTILSGAMTASVALSLLSFSLLGCGPPLFEGTSVTFVIEESTIDLESHRPIEVRPTSTDPYRRVRFNVEGLEVGWPSTEKGLYQGDTLVRLEYVTEHEFQRVTYRTRYCDVKTALVEITGEEYGLLKGFFAGEVCQFSSTRVAGVPESLIIGGAFAGTVDE